MRIRLSVAVGVFLFALPLLAAKEWYDSYQDGVAAAKKQNWSLVIQKMNESLAKKPSEDPRARTYGTQFLKYRPYYYRGIANFNLGNFEEAKRDLEKTGGAGDFDLGSAESFASKAQTKLAEGRTPSTDTRGQTTTTTTQDRTDRTPPVTPTVDVAAREARTRAERMLSSANSQAQNARKKDAPTYAASAWQEAQRLLEQASSAAARAESASEWNSVGSLADRAARTYASAATTAEGRSAQRESITERAADEVLGMEQMRKDVRRALESYYGGRFDDSAARFEKLVNRPAGGDYPLMWAFLGAAYYYSYYLEGQSNAATRRKADMAFRRAKQIKPNLKLSAKYFSPRVRRYYESVQ